MHPLLLFGLAAALVLGGMVSFTLPSRQPSPTAPTGGDLHPDQTPPPSLECGFFNASLAITFPSSAAGPSGTHISLVGSGFFGPNATGLLAIFLASESGTYLLTLAYLPANTTEPFNVTVAMPDLGVEGGLTLGTYYIWAGSDIAPAICADAAFTLTGVGPPDLACESWAPVLRVVSPTPATGDAGTNVTLHGVGFYANNLTGIYWAAADGLGLTLVENVTTGSTGEFNASVGAPTGFAAGTYFFWGQDGTPPYDCAGAIFNLTGGPNLTLSPSTGAGGTLVSVNGTGFAKSDTSVNITGAVLLFPLPCTLSGGAITGNCSFQVDGGLAGLHTISGVGNVVGGPGDTATATFTLFPTITLNPSSGPMGSSITISGYDFSAYPAAADVWFDGRLLTPSGGSDCGAGRTDTLITPDAEGQFVCTFTVPTWATPAGNTVVANDTFTVESSAPETFTVTTPFVVTLSSTNGTPPVITFTVGGLAPSTPYYVFVDSTQGVPSAASYNPVSTCTTSPIGILTNCAVTVPSGLGSGRYYLDLYQDPDPPPFIFSVYNFTVPSPPAAHSSPLALTTMDYELIAGIVAVVAIIAGVAYGLRRRSPPSPSTGVPPPPRGGASGP
jgi:hypothetical protein